MTSQPTLQERLEPIRECIRNLWRNRVLSEREHYHLIAIIDAAGKDAASALDDRDAEIASKSEQIGKLYKVCNEKAVLQNLLAEAERALEPFAKGANQIPVDWPAHRGLLIDEKHPENPKPHCLLLAYVEDFRDARTTFTKLKAAREKV